MTGMTRRAAMQRVAALMGGVALVGGDRLEAFAFDGAALQQTMAHGVGPFTATDVALLDEIADTILPDTSTPAWNGAPTCKGFPAKLTANKRCSSKRELLAACIEGPH